MKRVKIIILYLSVLTMLALCYLSYSDSEDYGDTVYAVVSGQKINVFNDGEKDYLFLPGYADIDSIDIHNKKVGHEVNLVKSANIDTVFINTMSQRMDSVYEDKEHRERATICIFDSDGNPVHEGGLKYIKGHGNYSWNNTQWDKKPFEIGLKNSESILGLSEGEKYILIANASDYSLIRNDIARKIEHRLGINYASEGKFVDLYIDSKYMGNYYLCPNIEISPSKINITDLEEAMYNLYKRSDYDKFDIFEEYRYDFAENELGVMKGLKLPENPADITGGYLLEREFFERYKLEYASNPSCFAIDSGEAFTVKSPKYCSKEEMEYISEYINRIDIILRNFPERASEYIDITSFAKRYLTEEITKNYDAGISSVFFYKDSDQIDTKLYYGPGWDYDMSLGNYLEWMDYSKENSQGMTYAVSSEDANEWLKLLYLNQDYYSKVVSQYLEIREYLEQLSDEGITDAEELLKCSASMDRIRWKDMYEKCGQNYERHSEYDLLRGFLRCRLEYLDSKWIDGETDGISG